ncbi:hypothetical protein EDD16DRAFT_878116 [Pisolithus croceorrhizus]|nr:hypothetical protein EDD16DRAFT_878116 [Pisolithus croceorrhizus]
MFRLSFPLQCPAAYPAPLAIPSECCFLLPLCCHAFLWTFHYQRFSRKDAGNLSEVRVAYTEVDQSLILCFFFLSPSELFVVGFLLTASGPVLYVELVVTQQSIGKDKIRLSLEGHG